MEGKPNRRDKAGFSNSCDGLVWKVSLTVEIKPAFTNTSGVVWPKASTCGLTTTSHVLQFCTGIEQR